MIRWSIGFALLSLICLSLASILLNLLTGVTLAVVGWLLPPVWLLTWLGVSVGLLVGCVLVGIVWMLCSLFLRP